MRLALYCEDHADVDTDGERLRIRDLWGHWLQHRRDDRERRERDAVRARERAEWDALTPEEQQARRDAERARLEAAYEKAKAYAADNPADPLANISASIANMRLSYLVAKEYGAFFPRYVAGGYDRGGIISGGLMTVTNNTGNPECVMRHNQEDSE